MEQVGRVAGMMDVVSRGAATPVTLGAITKMTGNFVCSDYNRLFLITDFIF